MDHKQREQEAQELWAEYKKDPTVENSNKLVEHYLYLVKPIVLRMSPLYQSTFRDYDDLISSGVLGLMDAVGKFDVMRNIRFETYAQVRIRGAILDYMRQQDWIPSAMRKEIKLLRQASEELSAELNRSPEYEELAERLNMPVEKVKKIVLNDYQYSLMHFEDMIGGISYHSDTEIASKDVAYDLADDKGSMMPEKVLLETEAREVLISMIRSLPENERLVLDLCYRKELKMREIAEVMGLTESRISQIHKQAIGKIVKRYQEEYENIHTRL